MASREANLCRRGQEKVCLVQLGDVSNNICDGKKFWDNVLNPHIRQLDRWVTIEQEKAIFTVVLLYHISLS